MHRLVRVVELLGGQHAIHNMAFAASAMFVAVVVPLQVTAQVVDGTGTTYVLPRWIDSNTLGNSHISDKGGVVAGDQKERDG